MEKKYIFFYEKKNGEGKYLKSENIILAEEKKTEEGKGREYLGKDNTCFAEDRKSGEGKGGK